MYPIALRRTLNLHCFLHQENVTNCKVTLCNIFKDCPCSRAQCSALSTSSSFGQEAQGIPCILLANSFYVSINFLPTKMNPVIVRREAEPRHYILCKKLIERVHFSGHDNSCANLRFASRLQVGGLGLQSCAF